MKNQTRNGSFEPDLLHQVQALLEQGRPEHALELLRPVRRCSGVMENAYGVCLLRSGQLEQATSVFRSLVLSGTGFSLRPNVPTVFKTNYGTALLLGMHVDGCVSVLNQIEDQQHPAVARLRTAIEQWKTSLSRLRRLLISFAGLPDGKVPLGFPPGDLGIEDFVSPRREAV